MRLQKCCAAAAVANAALLPTAGAAGTAFDRKPWLEDYAALKQGLEKSYANLAWFGSPRGGVDLPALDRRTRRLLAQAGGDEDAAAALLAFVARFHDGHLEAQPALAPAPAEKPPARTKPQLDALSAADGCAALGYAPVRGIAYSLPFDALTGSAQESDGAARVFRAGTLDLGVELPAGIQAA